MTALGWVFLVGSIVVLSLVLYVYDQDKKGAGQRWGWP